MSGTINRTILLKVVKFKPGKRKEFSPPRIDDVLQQAWDQSESVETLLYPSGNNIAGDRRRCFMVDGQSHKEGFSFQFCTYIPNSFPPSVELDFSGKEVDIDAIPVKDDDGNPRQVVSVTHVLAFGQVLIVESVKGSGGTHLLEDYLNFIVRKVKGSKHPRPHLYDAVSRDLKASITHGGGAVAVDLSLVQPNVQEGSIYANTLTKVQEKISGTEQVLISWRSKAGLDSDEVLAAFNEAETNDALDRIVIHLNNGETINLSKYRIRRRVSVQSVRGNNPASSEMVMEMRSYLLSLMEPDDNGVAILTDDGQLVADFQGE